MGIHESQQPLTQQITSTIRWGTGQNMDTRARFIHLKQRHRWFSTAQLFLLWLSFCCFECSEYWQILTDLSYWDPSPTPNFCDINLNEWVAKFKQIYAMSSVPRPSKECYLIFWFSKTHIQNETWNMWSFTCFMASTSVTVFPVPGGPKIRYGAGLCWPDKICCTATFCSGLVSRSRLYNLHQTTNHVTKIYTVFNKYFYYHMELMVVSEWP